jgi:hypothetical protein
MGWFSGNGEDDDTRESSFLANLTGVPNTDSRGQGFALAAALANAGSAVANANRPGHYGPASTGGLLSAGVGGFTNGLGMQAMMRQKAAIDEAKRKMADMQMRGMQQEQEGWQQANKAQQEGGQLEKLALLPGPVGAAVRQILQQRQEEQYKQAQLGLQRDANARGWAALNQKQTGAEKKELAAPNKAQEWFDRRYLEDLTISHKKSSEAIATYDRLEKLIDDGVNPGLFYDSRLYAQQGLNFMGAKNSADVSRMEQFKTGTAELKVRAAELLKGQGQISDYERKTLEQMVVSSDLTPQGYKDVVKVMRDIESRRKTNAERKHRYYTQHGTFFGLPLDDEGFGSDGSAPTAQPPDDEWEDV